MGPGVRRDDVERVIAILRLRTRFLPAATKGIGGKGKGLS